MFRRTLYLFFPNHVIVLGNVLWQCYCPTSHPIDTECRCLGVLMHQIHRSLTILSTHCACFLISPSPEPAWPLFVYVLSALLGPCCLSLTHTLQIATDPRYLNSFMSSCLEVLIFLLDCDSPILAHCYSNKISFYTLVSECKEPEIAPHWSAP